MRITAALVLFAVTSFMVFFIVLPIRFTSRADTGEVVPGTPKSAPADYPVAKKARITTLIAFAFAAPMATTSSGLTPVCGLAR